MRTLRISLCAAAAAAILAGCQTSPVEQSATSVEDRSPKPMAQDGGKSDTTTPIQSSKVETKDLTAEAGANRDASSPLLNKDSILARRSVFFDYDRFDVRDEFKPMMEAHARWLRDNGGERMLIQGNTDERGSREYNLALGQKRADSMKRMLTLLGAKDDQIEAVSLGEEKPRADGQSEEAYAQNRRGDILYKSVREY